jgi:hypothetical protein
LIQLAFVYITYGRNFKFVKGADELIGYFLIKLGVIGVISYNRKVINGNADAFVLSKRCQRV